MKHQEWLRIERKHHDDRALEYVERYGEAKKHRIPEEMFLFSHLREIRNPLIIDIGCGPALSISKVLQDLEGGFFYIGVDISIRLLEMARRNLPQGHFLLGDGSIPPLKEGIADVVLSLGFLHHAPDEKEAARRLLSLLKQGGYLLIREPAEEAFRNWKGESPLERGIDPEGLIKVMERGGGRLIDYRRFNSTFSNRFQHLLHLTRLYHLVEWSRTYWKAKTRLDVLLDKRLGGRCYLFRGCDFSMVIRRER